METSGKKQTPLALDMAVVRRMLVQFIHDEVTKAGFSRGIVGLSGGVDSSLVAFLAAEALGPENILGLLMPYRTSSGESLTDAQLVADRLAIRTEKIDISPAVDALVTDREADLLRKGNIMARVRMILLYDRSARDKALVIGTSNKTETMLGYGTQFGDIACAINPVGDLYKTQIWQLAGFVGVPVGIIGKKPTADLWAGQTDEEELGFSYRLVDQLLSLMVDERRTAAELNERGFEKHLIEKVERMIRRNQFKRRPPLVAKISHRTVNVDFRYPRDWGM